MEQTTQNESSPSQEEIYKTIQKLQIYIDRYIKKLNEYFTTSRGDPLAKKLKNESRLHKANVVNTMLELHKFNAKFNLEKAIKNKITEYKVSRSEPKYLVASIMNDYNERLIEQINQNAYKSDEKPTKEPVKEPAKVSTGVFNTIATTLRDLFTSP